MISFQPPRIIWVPSSIPPDNMALHPAIMKADQSLSELQTGIGIVAHATLDTEQIISLTRVVLGVTIFCPEDSEGGVISVSEVCITYQDS